MTAVEVLFTKTAKEEEAKYLLLILSEVDTDNNHLFPIPT